MPHLPKSSTKAELREAHREKMARKARLRAKLYPEANAPKRVRNLLGIPASMNSNTLRPHEHKREIARRLNLKD